MVCGSTKCKCKNKRGVKDMLYLGILIGLIIGTFFGVFLMCLLQINRDKEI